MTLDSASYEFLAFGLVTAGASGLGRSVVWRSAVLMAASVTFLTLLASGPLTLAPLVGFLLLGYLGTRFLARGRPSSFVLSLCAVVFAYVWLKRYSFLPEEILLHRPYLTLGLSYIFFRVLQVLIQAHDGDLACAKIGVGAYLLYTLNFTTLVSGPIQRYEEFARDQFAQEPLPLSLPVVGRQFERIVIGFFKVNVLALVFDTLRADALSQLSYPVSMTDRQAAALQLAIVYPLFLYCNFSGYIDIVIALARLVRIELPENFNRPFSATSFLDFWNRWHITLSTWLKTYVYNPLLMAMMRRIKGPRVANYLGIISFFVTFFLVGVWHGRTSEFVVFGVLQGGGVATNKLWQVLATQYLGRKRYKALAGSPIYTSIGRGLTFTWFAFTMFFFWADWARLRFIYFSIGTLSWLEVWLLIWLSATVVLEGWERLRVAIAAMPPNLFTIFTSRYARVILATALCVISSVVAIVLDSAAPAIVYKAF